MHLIYPKAFRRGNIHRAQNALKKEQVRIAFLGSMSSDFLDQDNSKLNQHVDPGTHIEFRSFLQSGLTSASACFMLDEVLEWNPDFVFLDFSLTDDSEKLYEEAYEHIVRTFLLNNCAVALILFSHKNGSSNTGHQRHIATYYNLPVLDLGSAIQTDISDKKYCWEDVYTTDECLSEQGYQVVRAFFYSFLDMLNHVITDETYLMPKKPCFNGSLSEFKYIKIPFSENTKENSTIYKETLRYKMIYFEFVPCIHSTDATIQIFIDGVLTKEFAVNSIFHNKFHHVELLSAFSKSEKHTLELCTGSDKGWDDIKTENLNLQLGIGVE